MSAIRDSSARRAETEAVQTLWPEPEDVVPLGLGDVIVEDIPRLREPAPPVPLSRPNLDRLPPDCPASRRPPADGWRRLLWRASGGFVALPPSGKEIRRRALADRVATPVARCHTIAFVSRKGGVGKTTTCLVAGQTLASYRGDKVVALDAGPDPGTLGERIHRETHTSLASLIDAREDVVSYTDLREYTSLTPSRLELLVGDDMRTIDGNDVEQAVALLGRYFALVCLDTAAGAPAPATESALRLADQVIIVSTPSLDAARVASATLDWIEHRHAPLAASAVVVLNGIRPGRRRAGVDLGRIEEHFASRCRSCVRIPWDPHLGIGTEVEFDDLRPATREAFLELAGEIGSGFTQVTEGRP
jgi:MinD-like ATPase involved in chromosome partitioning or flagellar assembly